MESPEESGITILTNRPEGTAQTNTAVGGANPDSAVPFVFGRRIAQGGMGAPETVPFSDRPAADEFVAQHNSGRVVTFDEIPRDYVLGSEPAAADPVEATGLGNMHE